MTTPPNAKSPPSADLSGSVRDRSHPLPAQGQSPPETPASVASSVNQDAGQSPQAKSAGQLSVDEAGTPRPLRFAHIKALQQARNWLQAKWLSDCDAEGCIPAKNLHDYLLSIDAPIFETLTYCRNAEWLYPRELFNVATQSYELAQYCLQSPVMGDDWPGIALHPTAGPAAHDWPGAKAGSMTNEELLAVLGKQGGPEGRTSEWLEWAKQVIGSAPLDKFGQLNEKGAAIYLCQILYLLADFDGGFAFDKCADLESVRLAFCSGLAVCRCSNLSSPAYLYQRGLDWCRISGLMRFETVDRWRPGMRSGSGMTDVVFLTPAGFACAFPQPAADTYSDRVAEVDSQPRAMTEAVDGTGAEASAEPARDADGTLRTGDDWSGVASDPTAGEGGQRKPTIRCAPPSPMPSREEAVAEWQKLTSNRNTCLALRAMLTALRGIIAVNDDTDPLCGCEAPLEAIENMTRAAGLDCPFSTYLEWDGCVPTDGQEPVFDQERVVARQPFLERDGWREGWPNDRKLLMQTLGRWIAALDGFAASFTPVGAPPATAGTPVDTQPSDATSEQPESASHPQAEAPVPSLGDEVVFYLSVKYDEAMFNHDPASLGRVEGDPNYYPVDSGTLFFFKVKGQQIAERLVRLFDRRVKPLVERQDETRVRASFSCQPTDTFDEDESFLIEEEIDAARATVERLDRDWQAANSPRRRGADGNGGHTDGHKRPLSGDPLSAPRLFDQARRWCDRLRVAEPGPTASGGTGPTPAADEGPATPIEPASADVLRVALPTAVVAAAAIRDLTRVRAFYPDVIPEAEAKSLHEQLVEQLKSAADVCRLGQILDVTPLPAADEIGSDAGLSVIMGLFALHHPDVKADPSSSDAVSQSIDVALAKCQQGVVEPVRSIAGRVMHAILYDCRMPAPKGDACYQEPQRFLQMVRAYWGVIRQIVLHHIEAPAAYRPHPLMPLLVNLKARIELCLDGLAQCEGIDKIRGQIKDLVELVLSGEPDDLSVVPEWSYEEVETIDRFLEEVRLALGAKVYPITPAEDLFLKHVQEAVGDYVRQIKIGWAEMLDQADAQRKTSASPASPPPSSSAAPPASPSPLPPQEPQTPQPFVGGEIVFYPDRVELCGVDICSGGRTNTKRTILNLLAKTQPKLGQDGMTEFASYNLDQLTLLVKPGGGQGTILGAIRDLRDKIETKLRNRANILCEGKDVILSGGQGYRFADCLTVRHVGQPPSADVNETPSEADEPAVEVRDDVSDDPAAARRAWILQRLASGERLQAPAVAKQLKCSIKTAQRDLTALREQGKIEYVGDSRKGTYRLCQPQSPDG